MRGILRRMVSIRSQKKAPNFAGDTPDVSRTSRAATVPIVVATSSKFAKDWLERDGPTVPQMLIAHVRFATRLLSTTVAINDSHCSTVESCDVHTQVIREQPYCSFDRMDAA